MIPFFTPGRSRFKLPMKCLKIIATLLVISGSGNEFSLAQTPPGINEFYQAGASMHSYYYSFSDLSLVLGGIVGMIGGLRVYINWQSGRHHIDAQVTGWFFSCLFLLLSGVFLRGVFGL